MTNNKKTNPPLPKLPFDCPLEASPYCTIVHNKETNKRETWFISDVELYETENIARTRMHFIVANSNGDKKRLHYTDEKVIPKSKGNSLYSVRKKLSQGSTLHPTNYKFAPTSIMNELQNVFNSLPFIERGITDEEIEHSLRPRPEEDFEDEF